MLTIVPTPIGNLSDITLRAIDVLKAADSIICEDSRRTSLLLHHYQIHKPLIVLNDFNEAHTMPNLIELLKSGQHLALVSDAGTPLVADPGYKLVRQAITEGLEVDSLPGANAAITALTLSGLPPDKFIFLGYLPEKNSHRIELLKKMPELNKALKSTYIFYVAPHKLRRTLSDIKETLGDNQEIVLARELTKIHQQVVKKTVSDWLKHYEKAMPKGEYVALLAF